MRVYNLLAVIVFWLFFWIVNADNIVTLKDFQLQITGVEKEIKELQNHSNRAQEKVEYHKEKVKRFTYKVNEIEGAKKEREFTLWKLKIEIQGIKMKLWTTKEAETPHPSIDHWTPELIKTWNDPNTHKPFNIDHLARAVGMAETWGCKKGYGATHWNCHWIKSGKTYPCLSYKLDWSWWLEKRYWAMCVFETTAESYEAFRVIWTRWYWWMPTTRTATKWTGWDRVTSRMANVNHLYYNN